jgi:4-hydroxythreonine-4-phosphate dehydrogenase
MGDANGVGPEIILRSYKEDKLQADCIVIGDFSVMEFCNEHLQLGIQLNNLKSETEFQSGMLNILDAGLLSKSDIQIGRLSDKTGHASIKYVEKGTQLALNKKIDALVTLPINKEAIRNTIPEFSGHTGFIADMCGTTNYTMMLASDQLIVTHISTHISLQAAIKNVKKDRILNVIWLTDAALKKMGKKSRIAVAGLNPHAGENNAFGREDSEHITPAVNAAIDEGIDVHGPLAADTVFYLAIKGNYDAVVCMYHDQGHIPIKLLAFESAVNITLGLPIIRTSVDHGTAFDIAYKGIASISSFCNAIELAKKLM